MHVPDEDAPALKDWIVKRLEDTSDADTDVLADYVLALITNNANNDANVEANLNTEIEPFLKKDAKVFTSDVVRAIKHKSYIPGAPPPPESQRPSVSASAASQPFFAAPKPPVPSYYPFGPSAAGRKRGFQDRGDFDAPDNREPFPGGGRPFKQSRRGGGRKGYVDPDRPQPAPEMDYGYNPRAPGLQANAPPFAPGLNASAPSFAPTGPRGDMASFGNGSDALEAIRKFQEMQQEFFNSLSQQGYPLLQQPQKKWKGRCHSYDNKGYCDRGQNCPYEHNNEALGMSSNLPTPTMSGQIPLPPGGQSLSGFKQSYSDPNMVNNMAALSISGQSLSNFNQSSFDLSRNLSCGEGMASGWPNQFQGGDGMPFTGSFDPLNSVPVSASHAVQGGGGGAATYSFPSDSRSAFNTISSSEVAASGHRSRQQNGTAPQRHWQNPGPSIIDSQQDAVSSSPAVDFSLCNTFSSPILTEEADIRPSIEDLMGFAQNNPMLSSPLGQVDMDHGDRSKHRRDNNRQGQQQRRFKGAGQSRASLSHVGPMRDRTQTTVVVESIPEENFEESQVRDFFAQFGNIQEVTMMPYKRLAVVKYDNWNSANAAYKSPQAIFNNRFVKVFWYKDEKHGDSANGSGGNGIKRESSDRNGLHGSVDAEEPAIDMDEFKRQQEEAQKAHEEKMRAKQELADQQADLERKRKELQAKQDEVKQRLLARLAAKKSPESGVEEGVVIKEESAEPSKTKTQTEILRETLAKLQEEAKTIGLDPNAHLEEDDGLSTYSNYAPYPPRGRGGYFGRGRGGYAPRGSYRGRGGGSSAVRGNIHAAYSAYSLDNRPKKVALTGVDFSAPDKDEALRQHLFSLGEFAAEIQVLSPAKTFVSFGDRKAAEKFYHTVDDALGNSGGGDNKIELEWVANTADLQLGAGVTSSKIEANGSNGLGGKDGGRGGESTSAAPVVDELLDSVMADMDGGGKQQQQQQQQQQPNGATQLDVADDEDYDVAGDNEWDLS
ncbi:unnamed protein product [Discula destructiva]